MNLVEDPGKKRVIALPCVSFTHIRSYCYACGLVPFQHPTCDILVLWSDGVRDVTCHNAPPRCFGLLFIEQDAKRGENAWKQSFAIW